MRALVLIGMLVAQPALAQKPLAKERADQVLSTIKGIARDWRNCVRETGKGWAHLRDGADVIAAGAMGVCLPREESMWDAEYQFADANGHENPFNVADEKLLMHRAKIKEVGIAAVLEERARLIKP